MNLIYSRDERSPDKERIEEGILLNQSQENIENLTEISTENAILAESADLSENTADNSNLTENDAENLTEDEPAKPDLKGEVSAKSSEGEDIEEEKTDSETSRR